MLFRSRATKTVFNAVEASAEKSAQEVSEILVRQEPPVADKSRTPNIETRDAREVRVIGGEVGQPMLSHRGQDEGVIREQSMFSAKRLTLKDEVGSARQDLNTEGSQALNRLSAQREFSDLMGVPLQGINEFSGRQMKTGPGLDHHEAVTHFSGHGNGGKDANNSGIGPKKHAAAFGIKTGKMVDDAVGIGENISPGGKLMEGTDHSDRKSTRLNSSH